MDTGIKVLVAGGSGAIGVPLVRALVASGYRVAATTRSAEKQLMLRSTGATPVLVDALDPAALERAVRSVAPTHVIHELTALPKAGIRKASELEPTNRLRVDGTRNLLRAAIAAGAKRIIVGSFAPITAIPESSLDEETRRGVDAVLSMESQVLDAARRGAIEAIVLRYGLFYGPGNPATEEMIAMVRKRLLPRIRHDEGILPYIHVDDAVSATVAALQRGPSGSTYEIVDDYPSSFSEMVGVMAQVAGAPKPFTVPAWLLRVLSPFMAKILTVQLPLSNAGAKRDLGWTPAFPSYREGLRQAVERAA